MLNWLNRANFDVCAGLDQFRFLRELKARGLAGRIGFHFITDLNCWTKYLPGIRISILCSSGLAQPGDARRGTL